MTDEERMATATLPLAEQRAVFFIAILGKLADGQAWDQIPIGAGAR